MAVKKHGHISQPCKSMSCRQKGQLGGGIPVRCSTSSDELLPSSCGGRRCPRDRRMHMNNKTLVRSHGTHLIGPLGPWYVISDAYTPRTYIGFWLSQYTQASNDELSVYLIHRLTMLAAYIKRQCLDMRSETEPLQYPGMCIV